MVDYRKQGKYLFYGNIIFNFSQPDLNLRLPYDLFYLVKTNVCATEDHVQTELFAFNIYNIVRCPNLPIFIHAQIHKNIHTLMTRFWGWLLFQQDDCSIHPQVYVTFYFSLLSSFFFERFFDITICVEGAITIKKDLG